MSATAVPLIGVSACRQQVGKNSSHTVGDKYVEAAAFAGLPLILPARDGGTRKRCWPACTALFLRARLQISNRIITMAPPVPRAPFMTWRVTG